MDIAGPVLNRLNQNQINETHDGRLTGQFFQRGHTLRTAFLSGRNNIGVDERLLHVLQHVFERATLFVVIPGNDVFDLFRRS